MKKWKRKAAAFLVAGMMLGSAGPVQAFEEIGMMMVAEDHFYLLPESGERYITEEEIEDMTAQELCYARNEIFAKYGRKFLSQELMNYFNLQTWYEGTYEPSEFPNSLLNAYEQKNTQTLLNREYELSPGGYPLDKDPEAYLKIQKTEEIGMLEDIEWGLVDDALSCYGNLMLGGIELETDSSDPSSIIIASHFFLMDMDEDGTEELFVYGFNEEFYTYHWKLYTWKDDSLVLLAQDNVDKPQNAGHVLKIMGGNCIVDASYKNLAGYDASWERYVTVEDGKVQDLEYYEYTEYSADEKGQPYESYTTCEYTLNGKGIKKKRYNARLTEIESENEILLSNGTNCGIGINYDSVIKYCFEAEPFPVDEEGSWILERNLINLGEYFELDVDGDGMKEQIAFRALKNEWSMRLCSEYELEVNGDVIEEYGDNVHCGVYVGELGTGEVVLVIYESGPSDDPYSTFFRYDKELGLYEIGAIPWPVDQMVLNEDGTIDAGKRTNVIQTDFIYASWEIDLYGELTMIPEEFYEMGSYWDQKAVLKQPIRVYEDLDKESDWIILDPQEVTFPYSNGKKWIYVEGEDGFGGWFKCGELSYEEINLLFANLLYAD